MNEHIEKSVRLGLVKSIVFMALILFCPVPVTDFMIGAGMVPLSYLYLFFVIWPMSIPPLCLLVSLLWLYLFHRLSALAAGTMVKKARHPLLPALIFTAVVGLLSFMPVYADIAHNADGPQSMISLYSEQYEQWQDYQHHLKLRESAELRRPGMATPMIKPAGNMPVTSVHRSTTEQTAPTRDDDRLSKRNPE